MIKLYGYAPTRSARCEWLLKELDVPFESIDARKLLNTEPFRNIHPYGKMPALEDNGNSLFESVAICNYLADKYPEKELIPKVGTWERALHDQWSLFALTEMEAYLWLNAKHRWFYDEADKVPSIIAPNKKEFQNASAVIEKELSNKEYLVGNRFSCTDINVSYTLNWGRRARLLQSFPNCLRYLDNLYKRPNCPLLLEGRTLADDQKSKNP